MRCKVPLLFLKYRNGKSCAQTAGNGISRKWHSKIAEYIKLPNIASRSYQSNLATPLVNKRVDVQGFKNHGGENIQNLTL